MGSCRLACVKAGLFGGQFSHAVSLRAWSPSTPPPATICSKSSKSDMAAARRPSPHNSPWTVGTKSSAIPHTRTQSWTASPNRTHRRKHATDPRQTEPEGLTTRHRRCQKSIGQRGSLPGRHHSVTVGGIIQESPSRETVCPREANRSPWLMPATNSGLSYLNSVTDVPFFSAKLSIATACAVTSSSRGRA